MHSTFTLDKLNIDDIVVYLKNERTGSSTIRKCKFIGQVVGFTKCKVKIMQLSDADQFVCPNECKDHGVTNVDPDDVVHIIISKYDREITNTLEQANELVDKYRVELLKAKNAIFRLIGQFVRANKFNDSELYIHNYCESALESAFDVLGIEENYIKLIDFCKMWEENSRAIWSINNPGLPFNGVTADMHYDVLKEDYESWKEELDSICEDD